MKQAMQALATLFNAENIRLEEMVHFPLSGDGFEKPISDRLKEIFCYETPESLPPKLKEVLGDDPELIDGFSEQDVCAYLTESGIEGWLILLSTPVRRDFDSKGRYDFTWGNYTQKWFFCGDFDELLPQAEAWIIASVERFKGAKS